MRALCGRMPEGIPPADRKIGKAVTGLQGRTVTAHEVINSIALFMEEMETVRDVHIAEVLEQSIMEDLLSNDRELIKLYDDLWGPETKEAFKCVGMWY